ncbi:hypothetical protein [Brevundimonas sp.]|uniref:hypothetical protein n=1 Tax=Brevundimonas sp. TaxID=1871086 RepID=UPI002737B814|nr:hypothetical protein [Brevundimonas sp.]MDP3802251.1 hypothetical protein [Brevundimonas sp.]MDZ4363498.1 hypothetical protein [Brevundimonas sp.]
MKSAQCEISADQSSEPGLRDTWLRLAHDWQDMANDVDARATTARLMDARRTMKAPP